MNKRLACYITAYNYHIGVEFNGALVSVASNGFHTT